eukprot:gene32619-55476_t
MPAGTRRAGRCGAAGAARRAGGRSAQGAQRRGCLGGCGRGPHPPQLPGRADPGPVRIVVRL